MPAQKDTVAFDNKMPPCYLKKGTQLKLSENPLQFDQQSEILIIVSDASSKYLSIRLSDYIQDVYVSSRSRETARIHSAHRDMRS